MRRLTSYLAPSAWARRSAVGAARAAGAAGTAAARSLVITVGEAVPHAGQNAAPSGIAVRHEEQVDWVVTARKIRICDGWCNAVTPTHYFSRMLVLRIVMGLGLAYAVLVLLAWRFQEHLAFPAPRAVVPDPQRLGVTNGERVEILSGDGTRLVGWYLRAVEGGEGRWKAVKGGDASTALHRPSPPSPALLWFYGNGETVAAIGPIVRVFQPPGTAVLVVDYPGYGGSSGRATEPALYAAAEAAYAALAARPEVDPHRIYVYGRSLGSAAATYTATRHPVAGLILESPFTTAAEMARDAYRILPRFILRLSPDNLGRIKQVRCPVLLFHGTDDRLVPVRMGMQVAAAAPGPVEVVLIQASGHNDTYDAGGESYWRKVAEFVR